MRYEADRIIDGVSRYIGMTGIYTKMNRAQRFMVRSFVRQAENDKVKENIKEFLANNTFIQVMDIADKEGKVDVVAMAKIIKQDLEEDKEAFDFPLVGDIAFDAKDVDILFRNITGEELCNYENN
jgi:hypothetical protein